MNTKERPIIFSGPMVRAILEGRKTQTRRVMKSLPCYCGVFDFAEISDTTPEGWQTIGHSGLWWCECCAHKPIACPYGKPGDRLWVRETWRVSENYGRNMALIDKSDVYYAADDNSRECETWRPSIFMPRWASRLTLEVVSVKAQRLNDMVDMDAVAEGIVINSARSEVYSFAALWDTINTKPGHRWQYNPCVWVIQFKVVP